MSPPEVLAQIPARGGSKSIPRKNLLPVAGRPLIAYTIEQARTCKSITRVIVSTDDPEIAEVARKEGADVPFLRPTQFAQDWSPDIDVFVHALQWLAMTEEYVPELVVHLRPSGPLRRVAVIDRAVFLMLASPMADSLRSVSTALQTPYKMWRLDMDQGYLQPVVELPGVPDAHSLPRQRLPEVFWQNGYIDITRPSTIRKGTMCGKRVLPFLISEPIYELDYPEDVPRLEAALQAGTAPERPSKRWAV